MTTELGSLQYLNFDVTYFWPIAISREFDAKPEPKHHDDVMKWKHFPRNSPFVRGIHRSPVNSPHKGQWRGPPMFSLICGRINGWVNNREAGDFRRQCAHYDVIVMRRCVCSTPQRYASYITWLLMFIISDYSVWSAVFKQWACCLWAHVSLKHAYVCCHAWPCFFWIIYNTFCQIFSIDPKKTVYLHLCSALNVMC